MNCTEIKARLDDYVDDLVRAEEWGLFEHHLQHCASCRGRLDRALELRKALRSLTVPEPSDGFFERALAQAMAPDPVAAPAASYRRYFGIGGALAAGFALALVFNGMFKTPGVAPEPEIPGVSIALNQVREVSLVVESAYAYNDATFTVLLPPGVELAGFPDRREVSWHGRLAQGKNLLVLPIKGEATGAGELIAQVTHVDKSKTFKLKMDVVAPTQSELTDPSVVGRLA